VARDPAHHAPAKAEALPAVSPSPEPFATDQLAHDQADALEEERPRAARHQILARAVQAVQDETEVAPDERSAAAQGTGSGVNGGPGGVGHGTQRTGVVNQAFAFGGPSGAFRADVCTIEETVRRLTDITRCVPIATFFTDTLNVPPRRFDQGFPGIVQRTQWFAIKYRGRFSVSADDSYHFRLISDDGARLEIDGEPVLDNDGQHQPLEVSKDVRLSAGTHEFFVFYYQGPPDFVALQLFVKRAAHPEQLFSPSI
jgi:hypothetical protein